MLSVRFAIVVSCWSLSCLPVLAQGVSSAKEAGQTVPSKAVSLLDLLRYDAKQQGPLLFVAADRMPLAVEGGAGAKVRKELAGKILPRFSEDIGRRVLAVGALTALVPRHMGVIVTNPSKADPYADMSGEERLQVLFSLWTHEQWAKAGSDTGIGIGDLTEEQRPLWLGIFPAETIPLKKYEVVVHSEHGEIFKASGDPDSVPTSTIRFRVSRRTTVGFYAADRQTMHQSNIGNGNGMRSTEPDGTVMRQELEIPDGYSMATLSKESTYGVKLFPTVPSRAKPGQLDMDSPVLQVLVRLDNSVTTVQELLKKVALATRLDIVADKRYGVLPVAIRTGNAGESVPAGDLLKGITRSVNGTFRRIVGTDGAALYLLTDDVIGYGTRLAHLSDWARKPFHDRGRALDKARKNAAVNNPLTAIHFRKEDPLALPENLREKTVGSYPGVEMPLSELPPALRKAATGAANGFRKGRDPVPVLTDKVSLGAELRYEWVVPDGRAFGAVFNGGLHSFMAALAPQTGGPTAPPPTTTPVALEKMPTALKRRIVILPLPATRTETEAAIARLKRKGFNEAWFQLPFTDAVERTRETVALGRTAGIRIGVTVGWLQKREANPDAPDEIDVQGETGERWGIETLSFLLANQPESHPFYRDVLVPRYIDWVIPADERPLDVAAKVAAVPGLDALVLENTVAPGYGGWAAYGDGLRERVRFGYHDDLRVACIRALGFDLVDVGDRVLYGATGNPDTLIRDDRNELQKELALFRLSRNKAYLAKVFERLTGAGRPAPVYLSDRNIDGTAFPFYVRWERAERIPAADRDNDEEKSRKEAFRCSPDSLFVVPSPTSHDELSFFATAWKERGVQALKWGGMAYRIERKDPDSVREVLELLPDDAIP
ncbi:MAG: hypothetical protein H7145_06395 [Akkermansiaceae bacterium]|nr:hypothetical protein [Armatimonadota bacterium]